jgi:exopolysaccharide biosynthesis operon protein EpsL
VHACRAALAATCLVVAGSISFPLAAQEQPPPPPREVPPTTADIPLEGARFIAVGGSVTYDSNFFRDPGLVRSAESETIATAYAGIRIDKPYAQQRFYLDATATAYHYDNFSDLDFTGLNFFGAWYWHLTPHISGTLSASRTETPTQFQYTLGRQSNVTTEESYVFNLAGNVVGGWHVLLGASMIDRTSEQSSLQRVPDYTENRGEAGIRYLFRPGNQVDALWRRVDGTQASQVLGGVVVAGTENYQEDQTEVVVNWGASAKSTLSARITYRDRRYDQTPQFDFSGTAGAIRYAWLPTSKVDVVMSATRDLAPFQGGVQSTYSVANTLSLEPAWRPTVTTRLYLIAQVIDEQYPLATGSTTEREDTISRAVAGLDWRAARNLTFGASLSYEERASNLALVEYEVTLARISATLIF